MKCKQFYWLAIFIIAFNFWHSTMRGIWNFSILDSLTIGPPTIDLAHKTDPRIRPFKSYDGQFFYAMTFDPLLISKKTVQYIDEPLYRYRRMFYPLLGYAFAFGQTHLFPYSLFFVNLTAWILSGLALYKIGKMGNFPKWWLVSIVLFNTGLTYATFRTLSDTLSLSLILWGCYFWQKRWLGWSAIVFALASLTRETAVTVPLTIMIYSVYKNQIDWPRRFLFILTSLCPIILWWIYVNFRLPEISFPNQQYINFPFVGILKEAGIALQRETSFMEHKRTFSILIVTIPLILFLIYYFWKNVTFWGSLAFGQALFCSIIQGWVWDYHAGSARVVAPLMIFSTIYFFELHHLKERGGTEVVQ